MENFSSEISSETKTAESDNGIHIMRSSTDVVTSLASVTTLSEKANSSQPLLTSLSDVTIESNHVATTQSLDSSILEIATPQSSLSSSGASTSPLPVTSSSVLVTPQSPLPTLSDVRVASEQTSGLTEDASLHSATVHSENTVDPYNLGSTISYVHVANIVTDESENLTKELTTSLILSTTEELVTETNISTPYSDTLSNKSFTVLSSSTADGSETINSLISTSGTEEFSTFESDIFTTKILPTASVEKISNTTNFRSSETSVYETSDTNLPYHSTANISHHTGSVYWTSDSLPSNSTNALTQSTMTDSSSMLPHLSNHLKIILMSAIGAITLLVIIAIVLMVCLCRKKYNKRGLKEDDFEFRMDALTRGRKSHSFVHQSFGDPRSPGIRFTPILNPNVEHEETKNGTPSQFEQLQTRYNLDPNIYGNGVISPGAYKPHLTYPDTPNGYLNQEQEPVASYDVVNDSFGNSFESVENEAIDDTVKYSTFKRQNKDLKIHSSDISV